MLPLDYATDDSGPGQGPPWRAPAGYALQSLWLAGAEQGVSVRAFLAFGAEKQVVG